MENFNIKYFVPERDHTFWACVRAENLEAARDKAIKQLNSLNEFSSGRMRYFLMGWNVGYSPSRVMLNMFM